MKPTKLYKIVLTVNHIIKTLRDLKEFNTKLYLECKDSLFEEYRFLINSLQIVEDMHLRLRLES